MPFRPAQGLGVVTALAEESAHTNLKPIVKARREGAHHAAGAEARPLGSPTTTAARRRSRSRACCRRSCAARKPLARTSVRACAAGSGALPKLPKRQREIWNMIEERRELPLAELLDLADTTGSTVRRLEDKG